MKNNLVIKWSFLALFAFGSLVTSCTKFDTPPYVEEDTGATENRVLVKKYVLWVNLEGAGGGDLAKNALPDDGVIKSLLPHSRYAWNGLESEHVEEYYPSAENAVACASMLTGNMPLRHGIGDDTYVSEQIFDPDYDEALKVYPGFFQYIADYDKSLKTLAVTPWKIQNEKLLNKATTSVTTQSDEETLNTALLKLREEDNRVVYLSFKGVLEAAKNGGWQPGNAGYVSAMHTMDGYVGQLLEAVNARQNAYYEDWLVIITSNHGGTAEGKYGGMSLEERNMFGIFYYAHFSQPQEMNPGTVDVLRFDQSFQGVVIDSITYKIGSRVEPEIYRQFYSPDSLGGGMTVEYIMAARPSTSRSYIPGTQNGVRVMEKSLWSMLLTHTYASGRGDFFGVNDGTDSQQSGCFVNPMIHSFTSTMNFRNVSDYIYEEKVAEEIDKWGNITPEYIKKTPKRKGVVDIRSYYDAIPKSAGNMDVKKDDVLSKFRDNSNLIISDGKRWDCRYLLEVRIWNKELTEGEVTRYSKSLKLTPANCDIYKNLIGYWQFYKGEEGQFLKDDSLVVNQIPTVRKKVRLGDGTIEEQELPTEPIRLRKKNNAGYYVPIDRTDIQYTTLANTLLMKEKGRMMESVMPVPVILEWMDIVFPLEATRGTGASAFKTSKLDGLCYPWDPTIGTFSWRGQFMGDYSVDLEWRDYE